MSNKFFFADDFPKMKQKGVKEALPVGLILRVFLASPSYREQYLCTQPRGQLHSELEAQSARKLQIPR